MKKSDKNAAVPILERKKITVEVNETWLGKTQANILKGHGRSHVRLLFLRFIAGRLQEVKSVLRNLHITSALEQHEQQIQYKAALKKPSMLQMNAAKRETTNLNLYLSAEGYRILGIPVEKGSAFADGMAKRLDPTGAHMLGDTPRDWEEPFNREIHALIVFANEHSGLLAEEVERFESASEGAFAIIGRQSGSKLANESGAAIEHFGYADGLSQPLFFEEDFKGITSRHWNPEAPVGLALTKDFAVKGDDECFGSYLVFRKLEQNVRAFKESEHRLAEELDYTGTAEEAAGAMIVGRFEAGLPVLKFGSTTSPEESSSDNDFNYGLDVEGKRCPFHAHIRKTNPRGDTVRFFGHSEEDERSHRIVRRGITYGDRRLDERGIPADDDHPSDGVGLLFMSFQNSIENQFEHIQRAWANNNDFPCPFTGIDPVIGHGANRKKSKHTDLEQQWRNSSGELTGHSFSDFVTMKGGEYFFAPSLPFFKAL